MNDIKEVRYIMYTRIDYLTPELKCMCNQLGDILLPIDFFFFIEKFRFNLSYRITRLKQIAVLSKRK